MIEDLKKIQSVCQNNRVLNTLSQRAHYLAKLDHILQQSLPIQLSAHCYLANIKNTTLILHTDNAAFASLIRFQAPHLCQTLSKALEQKFDQIEVKVRPRHTPLTSTASNNLSLPKSAASVLQQTADDMSDGALKIALNKLAKRSI